MCVTASLPPRRALRRSLISRVEASLRPFRYRFFGKQELGSRLATTSSLLLLLFALTVFLSLPQFGRRGNLLRRHNRLRPHLGQESPNWQIFCLQEGSQENQSSPLCTTQPASSW